jgi:hypothetical protein
MSSAIYAGALLPADIAAAQVVGPDIQLTTNTSMALSSGAGSLTVNWPAACSSFTLESSPTLGSGAVWAPVNTTSFINGMNNQVTVLMTKATRFFRLRR